MSVCGELVCVVSECAIVWRVCECAMVRVVSSVYECMASVW